MKGLGESVDKDEGNPAVLKADLGYASVSHMKTDRSKLAGRMAGSEPLSVEPPHQLAGAPVSDPARCQSTISPGRRPAPRFLGSFHDARSPHRDPEPLRSVGRDSVEPTFERSEVNAVSIFGKPEHRDARGARTASGGKVGSTESRPTGRFLGRAAGRERLGSE